MAGGFPLDPVLAAAARPVGAPAGRQRAVQRLVVHPGEHEHLAGVVLLGDGGHKAVGVSLEPDSDLGVKRRRPDGLAYRALTARHSPDPTEQQGAYHRGVSYARNERTALCALFDETGPEAPTLCEGWQTRHLAAHLVLRERRPDAAAGILGGPLAGYTRRVTETLATRTPFPDLVAQIRNGPPALSFFRIHGVDERANLVEYFVHHEDVRRAPVGVELVRDGLPAGPGQQRVRMTAKAKTPVVTVTGHPSELLMWALGRTKAAQVRLDGSADAVRRLSEARIGL